MSSGVSHTCCKQCYSVYTSYDELLRQFMEGGEVWP